MPSIYSPLGEEAFRLPEHGTSYSLDTYRNEDFDSQADTLGGSREAMVVGDKSSEHEMYSKDFRFYLVIVGMSVTWLVRGMDDTIVTTITPQLANAFHDIGQIGWFTSAYLFPQAALMLLFGKVSLTANLRFMWGASSGIFLIGSIISIVAQNGTVFILGRAVTGLGVAASCPAGLTILTHITTASERPFYIAIIVGVQALSLSMGAILGGVITEKSNYRICFVLNFPLGAVGAFLVCFFFRQPAQKWEKMSWAVALQSYDPAGCFLLVLSTLSLLLGLEFVAETDNWKDPRVIVFLVIAGLSGIGLVLQQRSGDRNAKFVPPGILNREVSLALVMGFLIVSAYQLTLSYLAVYFETVKGFSAIRTGFSILPTLIFSALSSVVTGVGLRFSRYANPYMLGSCILLILGSLLLMSADEDTTNARIFMSEIIFGIGTGIGELLAVGFAQQHVAPELQALTLSLTMMIQLLGGAVAVTIGGTIFNTQLAARLKDSSLTKVQQEQVAAAIADPQSLRGTLPDVVFQSVIKHYSESIDVTFMVSAIIAGAALLVVVHQKWIVLS
ncbi:uncharacterized protein PAC_12021 [Phialocephala subalpina]|uniref:Major facilitator superfamily (MFS) profile domain-containing protein n=1 Tax=Phialocephala subalpina TaxID=576137 RepID=A0A1L7XAS3_9HELO|nr:uncharacterized protein PAC_12021 [Phialocephala subalpina]